MSSSKPYSGIPLDQRRTWVVPRWLKDVFVAFALAAVLAVAIGKYLQVFGRTAERAKLAVDAQDVEPPRAAVPIVLPARGGGTFDLASHRGKLVLVNLWATWCPPCIEEMPSLANLAGLVDPASMTVVAVTVDTSWAPVDKLFAGRAPPYAVGLDRDGRVSLAYGTSKYPETYLVDADGNVRLKFVGPRDWSDQRMLSLLEQYGARRVTKSSGPEPKAHSG